MIPSSGCPLWPPDHPRTLPRTGTPTPPRGARPTAAARLRRRSRRWTRAETPRARGSERGLARNSQCAQTARFTSGGRFHPASCRCCGRRSRPHRRVRRRSGRASDRVNGVRAKGPGSLPDERRRRSDPKDRPEGEGPVLCGSVNERRAGEYVAEVRTSSQSERPCAGIEETRKPPGDAGGSSSPFNGDDHTGKRLAENPHEPFERADGGRATARPPPTLHSEDGKAVHTGKGGRCPETRTGRYARCEAPKPSWGSSNSRRTLGAAG